MKPVYQEELTAETQCLMYLLKMKTGIYNIETCVANVKPYLMEVSHRGGGCKFIRNVAKYTKVHDSIICFADVSSIDMRF